MLRFIPSKALRSIFVIVVTLAFAGAFGLALAVVEEVYPKSLVGQALAKVKAKTLSVIGRSPSASSLRWNEPFEIQTGLLPLSATARRLPPASRPGEGGGIAEYRGQLIVLQFDGRLLFVNEEGGFEEPGISLPDNGFEDYRRDAMSEDLAGYQHAFHWFRYHDILLFDGPAATALVVSMTRYNADQRCYETAVSAWAVSPQTDLLASMIDGQGSWQDLFVTSPCLPLKKTRNAIEGHMAGGRLFAEAGSDKIYLASGDYHWDGTIAPLNLPSGDTDADGEIIGLAQDPDTDYGKLIEIDFAAGDARHVSKGHRNPQGLLSDGAGRFWMIEHGPAGGDEINHIGEGEDFGWPLESNGDPSYRGQYAVSPALGDPNYGRHVRSSPPLMSWFPAIAPSALERLENFHPAWDGDLIVGTLRVGGLLRLQVTDGRVTATERVTLARGLRVRDLHLDGAGRLHVLASREFLTLTPASVGPTAGERIQRALATLAEHERRQVRQVFGTCLECHRLGNDQSGAGPSLSNFYDVGLGKTSFDNYSSALRADQRSWTPELLAAYLTDPSEIVPGTYMPQVPVGDPKTKDALVRFLIALNDAAPSEQ